MLSTRLMKGVAVSGGMDSMAMCTLLKYHREAEGWPKKIFAYTIDHGVRRESGEEAAGVATLVTDMGFNHRILKLSAAMQQELQRSMPTNLETVLRLERLRLWRDVVRKDALKYILTAHHEDDQYETLIQRIAWGSGMAGFAGIPPVNEYFVRPLLAYPKARLQATCEEHNVPWFTDSTNFEPTHAMRTAIRYIVRNQNDLPVALQKQNLMPLIEKGRKYKTEHLYRVNSMLSRCTFERDTFTGGVKVQFPVSMIRGLRRRQGVAHFIAALARVFLSGKVKPFNFLGDRADKASDTIVERFCDFELSQQFNVFGLLFRKVLQCDDKRYILYIAPELPRRTGWQNISRIVPIAVLPDQTRKWKKTTFEFPVKWHQPWKIKVTVKKDRGYYFRMIDQLSAVGWLQDHFNFGHWDAALFRNSKKRSRFYPFPLVLVICHLEGNVEKMDYLPRHGIKISQDIRVKLNTTFDLTQVDKEEYVDMKWDPELLKRREELMKRRSKKGVEILEEDIEDDMTDVQNE